MIGDGKDYRGGDIELSADRPRGLPFLKPLYGLPPYQYTEDVVLIIVYETEEAAIREALPRELEPAASARSTARWTIFILKASVF